MSELWRIVLTACSTVVVGVIVYTLGHLFVGLFIEPIHSLRSLIGEIAYSLVFYANVYSNPGDAEAEKMDEASETLRQQASLLKARAHAVPWYHLWASIRLVRKKTQIEEALAELIALSNSVHGLPGINGVDNYKRGRKIKELLGIGATD